MDDRHLSLPALARLSMNRMDDEDARQVAAHLAVVCPGCQAVYDQLRQLRREVGHWDDVLVVQEAADAPDLWRRLEPLPYDQQLREIEQDGALQTWALCRLLLRRSLEAAGERPDLAVRLATLGVKVGEHLDDAYDRDWVLDLRALALAHLGNALRAAAEQQGADNAFLDAHACLGRSGTGNERIAAEVLDLEAALRQSERRFDAALALYDQVIAIYRGGDPDTADPHLAARALVHKARVLAQTGDIEQAIAVLHQALPWIDEQRNPRLLLGARHDLLWLLPAAGQTQQASALLPEVQQLAQRWGNVADLIRLRWAEGRLALALHMVGPAEQAFREVQLDLLQRNLGYDAALVSLDLAALYAQEGCLTELKQLALDILPVFSSREIHREAMATLLLFQQACNEERLTVDLAHRLTAVLERGRPPTAPDGPLDRTLP
jgi:tetratricopeptide (TPR) repeat protein